MLYGMGAPITIGGAGSSSAGATKPPKVVVDGRLDFATALAAERGEISLYTPAGQPVHTAGEKVPENLRPEGFTSISTVQTGTIAALLSKNEKRAQGLKIAGVGIGLVVGYFVLKRLFG